jgi:hypothetical protein
VDRFEEDFVIVEVEGNIVNMKRERFPESIKEGDVIEIKEDGCIIILEEETKKREDKIKKMFNNLKK